MNCDSNFSLHLFDLCESIQNLSSFEPGTRNEIKLYDSFERTATLLAHINHDDLPANFQNIESLVPINGLNNC